MHAQLVSLAGGVLSRLRHSVPSGGRAARTTLVCIYTHSWHRASAAIKFILNQICCHKSISCPCQLCNILQTSIVFLKCRPLPLPQFRVEAWCSLLLQSILYHQLTLSAIKYSSRHNQEYGIVVVHSEFFLIRLRLGTPVLN